MKLKGLGKVATGPPPVDDLYTPTSRGLLLSVHDTLLQKTWRFDVDCF